MSLRCDISALPNVEETGQYIAHRLKVAGAEGAGIFSPGAIDYIFRCSEGIPRNINNLCDNALLNGFAAGEMVISRALVEAAAETFDMLPRKDRGPQFAAGAEAPVRIFNAAGRAELWAAGNGEPNGNGNGKAGNYVPAAQSEIVINEYTVRNEPPTSIEELGSAFNLSGLARK